MFNGNSFNILLTNVCTNSCSYCFAPLATSKSDAVFMSEQDISFALSFLERSGATTVRFLGGEPLLHPNFSRSYNIALEMKGVECVSVFTGANIPWRQLKSLKPHRTNVIVNVNHPDDYDAKGLQRVTDNLNRLVDSGVPVTIGHNIYRPLNDFGWLISLCDSLGIERMRVAIASPSGSRAVDSNALSNNLLLGSSLYALIVAIGDRKIALTFDCLVTPCLFSIEEWGSILRLFPNAIKSCGTCYPALDIHPDLRVTRCCGVGNLYSVNLRDYNTVSDLAEHFIRKIDSHRRSVAPVECQVCRDFMRFSCNGQCLGYFVDKLADTEKARESSQSSLQRAREAARDGKLCDAIEQFEISLALYGYDGYCICDYIWVLIKAGMANRALEVRNKYDKSLQDVPVGMKALLDGVLYETNCQLNQALTQYRIALRGSVENSKRQWIMSRMSALQQIRMNNRAND